MPTRPRPPASTTPSISAMQEETIELKVGAVIWATGWKPYDAAKIQPYGYDRYANVITSVEFERLADPARPDRRQAAAPVGRQGSEEHRLHPVRRLARREPPAPLLAHLLHGLAEADAVRARGLGRRGEVDRLLHRHPRHRPLRGFLPEGAERSDRQVRQVQGRRASPRTKPRATRSCHGVDTEGYHRYATAHDLVVLAIGMEPESRGIDAARRTSSRIRAASSKAGRPTAVSSAPAARRRRST